MINQRYGGHGGRGQSRQELQVDENRLKRILSPGGDAEQLNNYANELGEYFAKGRESERLSTSQIRGVLSEIQNLRDFDKNRLQLLRPKLAYAAGRHRGKVADFRNLLDAAIKMTNRENYEQFQNFVEAIVAYHRFHGGK